MTTRNKRPNGAGYLFKRGKYYCYRYMINGKSKQVSLKTTRKAEAERIVSQDYLPLIQARSIEGIALHVKEVKASKTQKKVEVSDAWNSYLKSPKRPDSKENTLAGYKSAFKIFSEWLALNKPGIKYISFIDDETAELYAQYLWLEKKVSERSFNASIKALDLILRTINGTISPFNKNIIKRKTEYQQGHHKFTEEQINASLAAFNNEELKLMHKQEMKILFHIGAMTGLRLIDACLLKWGNISFDDKLIRCIPHKTSRTAKQRQAVIPIPSTLNKVLRDALALRESPPDRNDFIMPNVASRYQYNSDGIGDDIKKVLEFTKLTTNEDPQEGIQRKKKICRYGFHSFRHYYASKMATEGYDINMLAKILADDIRTLQKYYINIDASAVREAFDTKEGQSNIKEQIVQALSDANEKQLQDIHNYVIKKITEKK